MHIVHGSGLGQMIAATMKHGENRVANVLPEKARAHDAKHRQEEDQHGHLKTDAEAENHRQEEAGVFLDGDHRVEFAAEVDDEDFERAGQYVAIAEKSAGEKQTDGRDHERHNESASPLVEAGGDEEPHLVEDEGRSDDRSADQRNLQVQVQRIHGMGVVELDVRADRTAPQRTRRAFHGKS